MRFRAPIRRIIAAVVLALTLSTTMSAFAASTMARWRIQPTPNPGGYVRNGLARVACPSMTACIAVGQSTDRSGMPTTLSEVWDGTKWKVRVTPHPFGARASWLSGVVCASPTSCIAVGGYGDAAGDTKTLVEMWDGMTWSIEPSPNPAGASFAALNGVACAAAADCVAVGEFEGSDGNDRALAQTWDGMTWSIEPIPDLRRAWTVWLNAVSCPRPTICVAVGNFQRHGTRFSRTLAEVWDGVAWKARTPPNPEGSHGSGLIDVACPKADRCFAVGVSIRAKSGSDHGRALVEAWNGKRWSIQAAPDPGGMQDSQMAGISCMTPTACVAVGSYLKRSGNWLTLAEAWDGSAWKIQRTAEPPLGRGSFLAGLACPAVDVCTAVGGYAIGSNRAVTLAERYS